MDRRPAGAAAARSEAIRRLIEQALAAHLRTEAEAAEEGRARRAGRAAATRRNGDQLA